MKNPSVVGDLRYLVADAWRTFGLRVPALVGLIVLSGMLEGLAVTAALPLLNSLGASGGSPQMGIVGLLGRFQATLGLPAGPAGIGVLMLGLVIASAVTFLLQARYATALQVNYAVRWQQRLFEAAMRAELSFLSDRRGGEVVNALVADVNRISGAFYHTCIVLAAVINLIVYLLLATLISPIISFAVVCTGALLLLATRPFMRRAYAYGESITCASADVQSLASDYIASAKLIKANVAEQSTIKRFSEAAYRLSTFNFKSNFDVQKAKAIFEFGGAVSIATLLISGPLLFSVDIATVLVVLALFVRLLPRVTALQQGIQSLSSLLPALSNLRHQFSAAREVSEPVDENGLPENIRGRAADIDLTNVTIRRGDRTILSDLNLKIPAGRIVALVGPSGSGKSTLVDALLRFVPLAKGRISVGSHDLQSMPLHAWRRSVGYVSQDTALLAGTIADNVRFGNDATDAALDSALTLAAAEFVDQLDKGKLTPVGDRGAKLSGGERQRLGLARALAVPRSLYILDEATSALDAELEARVVEQVSRLAGQATVIVVAHRFSAVKAADIIHVLEDGRIVESGSWDELDQPGRRFRMLKDLQYAAPTTAPV